MDATKIELAEQALERKRSSALFMYFVNTFCMMWKKEGGDPIPFLLWDFQKDACEKFQHGKKVIVLKARQMGMSWLAMAYVVWCVIFRSNFHVYITSIGLKEVNEQMERIRFIYYNLPEWMTRGAILGGKGCKDNDSIIEFTNGSAIHAIASSRAAGHGSAPGLYILDEFARKDNDLMAWRAIKPSLGNQSQALIISTSNGFNNVFADLWFGAVKKANDFMPVFYSALEHPDYTPEYLADMQADFAGDLQGYKEAFPLTADDAFLSSSRAIFDQDVIRYWKAFNKDPETRVEQRVGLLEEYLPEEIAQLPQAEQNKKQYFIDDPGGHLQIWKEPVKGHRYTMGVDVAEGLVDGDYSVAIVYDTDTHELVAMLRGKFPQETFAYPIQQLGYYYNNAWIVVEVNKGAELIMGDLKATYQWIYCRLQRANIWDKPTLVPGFYSSGTAKPRIIMQLRRKLAQADHPLAIYSDVVLKELAAYEQNDKKQLTAPRGQHDDCVMALALAVEGENTVPYTSPDRIETFGTTDERSWRSL